MLKFAFFTIFVVATLQIATAQNYCNAALCPAGRQHIGCNNNGNFAARCRNPTLVRLTRADRNIILRAHNRRRNQVAGGRTKLRPACRMGTMQWDNELARLAALNVRQCQMRHDGCRNTNNFRQSGQNLLMIVSPRGATLSIPRMLRRGVNMWYREIQNTQMSQINSFPSGYSGPSIGHFTVMVADRNIRVGCAAATYGSGGAGRRFLMACNYATTNVVNRQIYNACANPATGCTTGTNPNFPNLCSRAEQYTV